jgi:hypothetical protein
MARIVRAAAAAYVFGDDDELFRLGREAAKSLKEPRMVDLQALRWGPPPHGWHHCFSDPQVERGKGGSRARALVRERAELARLIADGASSEDLTKQFVFTTSFPLSSSACEILPAQNIPVSVDEVTARAREAKVAKVFARYLRDKRLRTTTDFLQGAERLIVLGYRALGVRASTCEGLFDFEKNEQ